MVSDESRSEQPSRSVLDDLDTDRLAKVLNQHPVRLAVLFGSRVKNTRHVDSDVDIAVEFERGTKPEEALLALLADLASATGGVDVDVAVLSDVEPRIGVSICRNGMLLVGDRDRFESHCQQFREKYREEEQRPTRDRFREIVETAKQAVGHDS